MIVLLLLGACAVGLEVLRRRQAAAQAPTLVPDMVKLWTYSGIVPSRWQAFVIKCLGVTRFLST